VGTFLFLSTFEKTPFFEINAHLFIERDKEFQNHLANFSRLPI
jgi:hypothetical protein